jgi:hypothetical protein
MKVKAAHQMPTISSWEMRKHATAEEDRAAELTPPLRPAAPWRVTSLKTLSGFRLRVRFNDATEGTVELAGFLHSASAGVFERLRDVSSGLDLAPDAMHSAIKEHGTWVVE